MPGWHGDRQRVCVARRAIYLFKTDILFAQSQSNHSIISTEVSVQRECASVECEWHKWHNYSAFILKFNPINIIRVFRRVIFRIFGMRDEQAYDMNVCSPYVHAKMNEK